MASAPHGTLNIATKKPRRSSEGWSLSRVSGMNGRRSDKLIGVMGTSLRWCDDFSNPKAQKSLHDV
jgi:hypothetical protein